MIQFNTTSPIGSNDMLPGSTDSGQTGSASFQNALSAALSATLEKFGIDPNQVNISIGSSSTTTSGSPMVAAANTFTEAANNAASVATPAVSAKDDSSTDPTQSSTESFDDAYWAGQPPAVQALRGMTDENQRMVLADQLQQQGYSIDVPVMVWQWDPSVTTSMRQSFGYTWIPALGQAPIQMAPGLGGFGVGYDPNNPPPGSIIVPPAAS